LETDVLAREIQQGDGPTLARIALENAAYYVGLSPDDFRLVDRDGLDEFLEPDAHANTSSMLSLVAEVDGEVVGSLEAELVPPLDSARYQVVPELGQTRPFINYVGTAQSHWRRGVATRLVEVAEAWGRSAGATIALCDTYLGSPVSLPFWEERMGYSRRSVRLRKSLV
jgi:GNAT superfamily N-acetyltransferase